MRRGRVDEGLRKPALFYLFGMEKQLWQSLHVEVGEYRNKLKVYNHTKEEKSRESVLKKER